MEKTNNYICIILTQMSCFGFVTQCESIFFFHRVLWLNCGRTVRYRWI